jgi:hypothetical protein
MENDTAGGIELFLAPINVFERNEFAVQRTLLMLADVSHIDQLKWRFRRYPFVQCVG